MTQSGRKRSLVRLSWTGKSHWYDSVRQGKGHWYDSVGQGKSHRYDSVGQGKGHWYDSAGQGKVTGMTQSDRKR